MNDCPNGSSKQEFTIVVFSLSPSGELGLSLGILIIYLITILGNLAIVFLVPFVPKLHTPMYFFLDHRIYFSCCMTQLYFFFFSGDSEVFMLTSMAYDRYLAICNPLQYYTIMRKNMYIAMAAFCWLFGAFHSLLHTLLTSLLQFCHSHEINNFFCDLNSVIALSTTNTESRKIYIFFELCVIYLGQFILTIFSYVFIFSAILKIRSSAGRIKAFSSCTSHLITVILYYVPGLFLYMKTDSEESKEQDTLLSMIYLILVPMLNPLVYSLRNKEVWGVIVTLTNKKMLKL
ncbi:hypothetical protein GDO78_013787 [Eleutherodactylus coqui]|uniref:G-protein coupled receptors family 1 profile domain-containing protein n=1 Tax=Eleutherodactylus coqui TaxID=57060 RepID=A0A8J6JQV7_ELECQ|nr:hypothetical protein GDO78_013787 [Eleutherodactylus coqui]